jgi:hypothetical protein
MQSQRHRTVIPGKLGPKEKIVSNFSFPTRMSGTATTKSHHAKQNGPDLAGGIGVEAGTCSLGKSEFRISTPVCIVTALMSPCAREWLGARQRPRPQGGNSQPGPRRARSVAKRASSVGESCQGLQGPRRQRATKPLLRDALWTVSMSS